MPRITRSQTKARSGESKSQDDEVEKSASEYEPNGDDPAPARQTKQQTKGKKKERLKDTNIMETQNVSHQQTITLAPGVTKSIARQNYALPLPSNRHRHRGTPVYLPAELQASRLLQRPSPFFNHETVWTKSVANPDVLKRVTRALSNNVGEGPIWELLEDRSWFKECSNGQKRPLVYGTIAPGDRLEYLTRQEATPYLPSSFSANSAELQCYLGPYNNQAKHSFKPLQHFSLSKHVPELCVHRLYFNPDDVFSEKISHVFYAGGPVWAIDWCPMLSRASSLEKQYLAVGPLPSNVLSARVGRPVLRPSPACIQIWSLSPSGTDDPSTDPGTVACTMILCIDSGPALDLRWCPLPTYEESSADTSSKKLGILAGIFEDGSVSFYAVPHPDSLPKRQQGSEPFFVKLDPRLRIEVPHTTCLSFDWANSSLIAIGCSNGHLAIFQVKKALEDPSYKPYPSHYISVHQSAIRSVTWVRAPPRTSSGSFQSDADPTVILSGGYDGALIATDVRDLRGNVIYRTRDVINSIGFSHHVGGFLAPDNECTVKDFGLTPLLLGRGHSLVDLDGPIWSIATSDFHPQLAVGSADGTCRTTNIVKSTRKGGLVPFFIHKIYQLDYNRLTGEFRLLDNILPYEYVERSVTARPATKKDGLESIPSSGAWPPEVGVTKVVWNSGAGMARSPWLASATASGLCRLDWLLGRFVHDRFPYGDIQTLRGDIAMDEVDELEDDDDEDDDN